MSGIDNANNASNANGEVTPTATSGMIGSPTSNGASKKDPLTLMAMWGSMKGYDPKHDFSFEGPEKRLEVIMRSLPSTAEGGLHSLPDDVWDNVVASLNAQIVSKKSNEFIKSYVLTESSLFVMKTRIILITCGTTTLLESIPRILGAISAVRGELEWVSFMHKNYSFPWEQKGPHHTMGDEYKTLKTHFPTGKPYIFGPVDSDHYFLFCFDDVIRPNSAEDDTQLSMTMYGLDKEQTKYWFSDRFISTGEETEAIRKATKLDTVVDSTWDLHDLQFEPCGYSVNAIRGEEYQTMHITPEDHCSFASYETNSRAANYSERMKKVLGVFRPRRFTVIVFIDPESAVGKAYHSGESIGIESAYHDEYTVLHSTVNEFAPGYVALKVNYVRIGEDPIETPVRAHISNLPTVNQTNLNEFSATSAAPAVVASSSTSPKAASSPSP